MDEAMRTRSTDSRPPIFLDNAFPLPDLSTGTSRAPSASSRRRTRPPAGLAAKYLPVVRRKWTLPLLRSLDGEAFEAVAAAFWQEMNFRPVPISEGASDRSAVDIWLYQEGNDARIGAVQCHSGMGEAVEVKPIQELAVMVAAHGVEQGVAIAQETFSQEARAFVQGRAIELIGGEEFLKKIRSLSGRAQRRLLRAAGLAS